MSRIGGYIETYTGQAFYPLDPRPEEINIEDIAHALSLVCRYNGHVRRFYSVAEHSVLLAVTVPVQHRTAALLHDASEAYLCDLPRPIKRNVTGYVEAEDVLMRAIAAKFGFAYPLPDIVKQHDTRILLDERAFLMPATGRDWDLGCEPLGVTPRCWSPEQAEAAFLETFYTLGEQVRRQ